MRIAVEVEHDAKYVNNRWNDAKADPAGRLVGGTMRLEAMGDIFEAADGSLYSFAKDHALAMLKTKIGVSNGLTWNEKTGKFYYVDTCAVDIKEFDYDFKTGKICKCCFFSSKKMCTDEIFQFLMILLANERVLISFYLADGKRPAFGADGLTIDAEGFLYLATWGGSKVLRIDPSTGKIVLNIEFPAEQITSVAFGGPNLDELFVTSAATARDHEQPFPAGSVFKVTGLGFRGLPMNKVRL